MFGLTPDELSEHFLDCAAGPASFNVEATRRGFKVTSCDPIYRFRAQEIRTRINETLIANAAARHDEFVWRDIESPEHLGEVRMAAMQTFLEGFPAGLEHGRYTEGGLPDLSLCSSFLFTYSELLSTDFHIAAIEEMCRVADEARVFPLLKSYGGPSPHLEPVMDSLQERGYRVEIRRVQYEFQRSGNELLSVIR